MKKMLTMKFVELDHWDRPIYKCIETNTLWKDINLGDNDPCLYSCQNQLDGEPECPIKKDIEIVFVDQYKTNPQKFEYMLLSRMQADVEYYLGCGKRRSSILNNEPKGHIERMKELHNCLKIKPQWLSYTEILDYEKRICLNEED